MIINWTIASILCTTLVRNVNTLAIRDLRFTNQSDYLSLERNVYFNEQKNRRERFLLWSYPSSPLIDMVMQKPPKPIPKTHEDDSNKVKPELHGQNDFLTDYYPSKAEVQEYDYIIVGGGTSGSVIAARLTEKKSKFTVLVIEAGKPEMLLTDIPALVPYLQLSDYIWPYSTEPQSGVCIGSVKNRCFIPLGKALGGSSVTDYMIYTRGRPDDWNAIAGDGNYGWTYSEVLPYFVKSENCQIKKFKNSTMRGRDGELTVENVPFKTGLAEAFLKAGRIFGYPTIDYNSPHEIGFGYVQVTMEKGHRLSTAKAFLHRHKRRKNLHILTEARATKIIIDAESKKAHGVQYRRNGSTFTVRCRREIILAAGPISSPQLLMLSGIGPQDQLAKAGIPVISNIQVGATLYDHIAFPGIIFKLNSTNASLLEPKVATVTNLMQWLQYGDGLLSSPGAVEALGFVKTSQSRDTSQIPDVELISLGGSINIDGGGAFRKSVKITDEIYQDAFSRLSNLDTWSAIPILLRPRSRGHIKLVDQNPYTHPKIYGNYLSNPQDLATLVEATKYVIRLGQSEAFRKYDAKLFYPDYPTCRMYTPGTDSYWECAIRTLMVSARHLIATCKMGPPNDPYAVVDPELRVYGIDGLRVADASIIPRPISAHLKAPLIMIGEKTADMILKSQAHPDVQQDVKDDVKNDIQQELKHIIHSDAANKFSNKKIVSAVKVKL